MAVKRRVAKKPRQTRRGVLIELRKKGIVIKDKKVPMKTLLKFLKGDVIITDVVDKTEDEVPQNKPLVPKGRMIVSFVLKVHLKDRGHKSKRVTQEVTIKDDITEETLVDRIAGEYVEKHYNNSELDITGKVSIKITPVTETKLADIKNKDHRALQYRIFPDDLNVNKTPGQCVLDMVVVEMQSHFKTYTRVDFIKEMTALAEENEKDFLENGISERHLKAWVKSQTLVTMFALDPMLRVFDYHVAKNARVRIMFIVNNGHTYPIRDDAHKKQISDTKKLNFQAPLLQQGGEECEYALEEDALKATKKVVHVETDDLSDVLVNIVRATGYNCVGISVRESHVTSFQHPITDQIFIASAEYLLRKDMCDVLLKKSNYIGFVWKNQSWAEIWNSWLECKGIKIPLSHYNKQTLEIQAAYPMSGYLGVTREVTESEQKEVKSLDIDKCYSSCLMENEDNFIIEELFDDVEPFSLSSIPIGKAYLSKSCKLGAQFHSRGWYPSFFVKYLLEHAKAADGSKLTLKDVTYIQRASHTIDPHVFRNATKELLELCPKAKKAINAGVGAYGRRFRKTGSVAITDSADVAFSMINDDKSIQLTEVGNFWLLRKQSKEQLYNGYVSIRNHIVCMGHVKLFEMEQKICDANTEVICLNTDSIKVLRPRPDFVPVDKANAKPGDICIEPKVNIRGYITFNERPEYKKPPTVFTSLCKIETMMKPLSFVAMGGPGFGKSYLLKSLYTKLTADGLKCAKWCWTKTAAMNIEGETLDHVFPQDNTKGWLATGLQYDVIAIDEFSMIPPHWYGVWMELKILKPSLIFQFYGDPNQLHSMPDDERSKMWYRYENSSLLHFLTDSNKLELEYIESSARYDSDLKHKLDIFERTNKLEAFFLAEHGSATRGDKRLFIPVECDFNIVKNWQKRDEINNLWVKYYSENKNIVTHQHMKFWEGMYLISKDNDKKIVNSVRYYVKRVLSDGLEIFPSRGPLCDGEADGKPFTITFEQAIKCMRYGYADTVMRMQSRTVPGKFNVWELSRMDKNEVFVALSRATSADNIGMEYNPEKEFKSAEPPAKGARLCTKLELFEGNIYERTDGELIYIGSTNNMKRRKAEHEEKPVSKKVQEWERKQRGRITMNVLATYICSSKRQLVEAEYTKIATIPADKCMNTNGVHKEAVVKNTTKYAEPLEIDYTRFKITDDEVKKRYRIQWRINGEKKEKNFPYRNGKKEAMDEAIKFRAELVREHFM